jgi:hypothetical protein
MKSRGYFIWGHTQNWLTVPRIHKKIPEIEVAIQIKQWYLLIKTLTELKADRSNQDLKAIDSSDKSIIEIAQQCNELISRTPKELQTSKLH